MKKASRREKRANRRRQLSINTKLKRALTKDMAMAPCCYCLSVFLVNDLTIEHKVPRCLGGTNDPVNIALACEPCNKEKGREAWFIKKDIGRQKYGR
jgi:5-methylcytosine-specific restriction endonuclease McrA